MDGHPHALCLCVRICPDTQSERALGVSAGRQMQSNAIELNILSAHH